MTVHATDPEIGLTDSPAFGNVKLDYFAASFKLGQTVTGTVPESVTALTLTGTIAESSVNHQTDFTIQLKDPPPPPPFFLSIKAVRPTFITDLPHQSLLQVRVQCEAVTFRVTPSWADSTTVIGSLYIDPDPNIGEAYRASVSFPGIRPSTPNVDSYTISVRGTPKYTVSAIQGGTQLTLLPYSEAFSGFSNRPNSARNKGCFFFNLAWTSFIDRRGIQVGGGSGSRG